MVNYFVILSCQKEYKQAEAKKIVVNTMLMNNNYT